MIPEILAQYLPQELKKPVVETTANCNDCYKTKKTSPAPHFDPVSKCCTYYPHIPNFLVGALLENPLKYPLFHAQFKKLVLNKEYVLPVGVCAPAHYQYLYNKKEWYDFGNRPDLICPFYIPQGGLCGVWEFRSHECATFYCVSDHGKKGEEHWTKVRDHLHIIELTISQEAILQMGYSDEELDHIISYIRMDPQGLDKKHPAQLETMEWTQVWGHHMDDIAGFFKSTYHWAQKNQSFLAKQITKNFQTLHP